MTKQKLLKLTDKAPKQHAILEEALTTMKDIAQHLEVKVADLEIKEKLTKLQHEITAANWVSCKINCTINGKTEGLSH